MEKPGFKVTTVSGSTLRASPDFLCWWYCEARGRRYRDGGTSGSVLQQCLGYCVWWLLGQHWCSCGLQTTGIAQCLWADVYLLYVYICYVRPLVVATSSSTSIHMLYLGLASLAITFWSGALCVSILLIYSYVKWELNSFCGRQNFFKVKTTRLLKFKESPRWKLICNK